LPLGLEMKLRHELCTTFANEFTDMTNFYVDHFHDEVGAQQKQRREEEEED